VQTRTRNIAALVFFFVSSGLAAACGRTAVVHNADNGPESCQSKCVKCAPAPRCPLDGAEGSACALPAVQAASCASGAHVGVLYRRGDAHDSYFACGDHVLLVTSSDSGEGRHKYAFDKSSGALVADAKPWGSVCTDGDQSFEIESRGGSPGFIFPNDESATCKPITLPCGD
jgi:hypothetical protein